MLEVVLMLLPFVYGDTVATGSSYFNGQPENNDDDSVGYKLSA
jgi:hypothetical protein